MFKHGFPPEWSTFKKLIWLVGSGIAGASYIWKTVTGSLIHITDALASPMQKCEVTLEPIQAGSGDPSPDNVRPITGWTGCEVNVTGVNVWDEEWELGTYLNITGAKYPSTTKIRNKNPISVSESTTYYYYVGTTSTDEDSIYCYRADMTFIRRIFFTHGSSIGATFTTPLGCAYINFSVNNTTYNNDISINYPSTDTSYHAYSGTTLSVTFPDSAGTVYGGTVDFVSGVLTVETATVDMASINWVSITVNGVSRIATAQIQNILTPRSDYYPPDGLHEVYKLVTVAAVGQNEYAACIGFSGYGYGDRLIINDPRITDPSQAPTVLSGTKFMYYLKEPIEIQLTPQPINTLKGVNNVWSNTNGDTMIIYKAQA